MQNAPQEEAARIATGERFADAGTTSGRATRKGMAHGYDDHRRRHQEELEQRFAAMVVEHYEAIRREVIQEVDPEKG